MRGSGPAGALLLATIAIALAIGGCGGDDDQNGRDPSEWQTPPDATFPEATVPEDAPQPPQGASPVLREIYRQFAPREGDPRVRGSGRAIAAGERACAGRTPVEVKEIYYPIAVREGRLDPESGQARMIDEIDRYAKVADRDPSFTAGQLAAGAYQATLASRIATFGYSGCVYALARQLQRRLAP